MTQLGSIVAGEKLLLGFNLVLSGDSSLHVEEKVLAQFIDLRQTSQILQDFLELKIFYRMSPRPCTISYCNDPFQPNRTSIMEHPVCMYQYILPTQILQATKFRNASQELN